MTAWHGRLPVREHLRPRPLRFQPCASWEQCIRLAALMHADPVALWPTLRRLTVHARDAATDDFTITDVDLDVAIATPTAGEA